MLRLITSDLVLDEIDSYSDEQLVLLSRLVFLAGLFGKNVLIVSASITEVLVNALYKQYQYGLNNYFIINQIKDQNINIGFFTEYWDKIQFSQYNLSGFSLDKFKESYSTFTSIIKTEIAKTPAVRRINVFNTKSSNCELKYENIFNQILALYSQNNEFIENKHVSIGFVKFNTTRNTIDFAEYLLNNFSYLKNRRGQNINNYQILVLCYHAKLLVVDRIANEKILDRLKRKNVSLSNIPIIYNRIKPLLNDREIENIIIIVSTSPIIETGRDHDYDWAILEPSSTRSIIQASDRVQRHRLQQLKQKQFNISLMSEAVNTLDSSTWYVERSSLFAKQINSLNVINNMLLRKIVEKDSKLLPILLNNNFDKTYISDSVTAFSKNMQEFENKIDQSILISKYDIVNLKTNKPCYNVLLQMLG